MRRGEVSGFIPGRAEVLRTAESLRRFDGNLKAARVRRYEAEGFVEAAAVLLRDRTERGAEGVSAAVEFQTADGAKAEIRAESKELEGLRRSVNKKRRIRLFVMRRLRVPGFPDAVAFAFESNKAARDVGIHLGTAKALIPQGRCVITVSIDRPESKEVARPMIDAVQSLYRRTQGACP